MHKGKSYHLLYNETDRGPGVLDFIAFKSAHSKEGRINCAEYLLLRNYKDSRYVTDIEGWLKEEKED